MLHVYQCLVITGNRKNEMICSLILKRLNPKGYHSSVVKVSTCRFSYINPRQNGREEKRKS